MKKQLNKFTNRIKINKGSYIAMAIALIPMIFLAFIMSVFPIAGMADGANPEDVVSMFINEHLQFLFFVIPFSVLMSIFVINVNAKETMKNSDKSDAWLFWRFILYQLRSIFALMIISTVFCLLIMGIF